MNKKDETTNTNTNITTTTTNTTTIPLDNIQSENQNQNNLKRLPIKLLLEQTRELFKGKVELAFDFKEFQILTPKQ
jgi:hypothetical protein